MDANPASSSELSSLSNVSAIDPPFERSGSNAGGLADAFGGSATARGGARGGARNSF
jgi:hypothetical protein